MDSGQEDTVPPLDFDDSQGEPSPDKVREHVLSLIADKLNDPDSSKRVEHIDLAHYIDTADTLSRLFILDFPNPTTAAAADASWVAKAVDVSWTRLSLDYIERLVHRVDGVLQFEHAQNLAQTLFVRLFSLYWKLGRWHVLSPPPPPRDEEARRASDGEEDEPDSSPREMRDATFRVICRLVSMLASPLYRSTEVDEPSSVAWRKLASIVAEAVKIIRGKYYYFHWEC